MVMNEFFKKIRGLNYIVQRNWDNLPESVEVDGHDDLDLFVSEEDRDELEAILKENPEMDKITDVRSARDNYYPGVINLELLRSTKTLNGVRIPNPKAHFNSLYYHNAVHKDDNPYGEKLEELFLEMYPAIKCRDEGVGFYA